MYGCAVAVKHIITDWGTNFGYCKMNPYRRSLDPIEAGRGDVVEIRFAPPFHVAESGRLRPSGRDAQLR